MANVLKGSYYPIGAPLRMPFADIDDVAAAHCLALAIPEANGRYTFTSRFRPFFDQSIASLRLSMSLNKDDQ